MSFSGRIGTSQSRLGAIVLGIADAFGLGTFGFIVHVLNSKQIRILFAKTVTESALTVSNYSLTSTAPLSSIVPPISGVSFYDADQRSVVLQLSQSLTYATIYSLQVFGVQSPDGEGTTSTAQNFTANVPDPPRALGAWQSSRGCMDILFDRPVGPYSSLATAKIRDASANPSSGVSMTQLTWSSEKAINSSTLRFSYPPGTPTANSFAIDFTGVQDGSFNTGNPSVPVTLALKSPAPYSYANLRQLQIVDALVSDVSSDFLNGSMVRVFFNGPTQNSGNIGNWTVTQSSAHLATATGDLVTAANAVDVPTLIALVNDIRAKFNAHVLRNLAHVAPDPLDLVTAPIAFDQTSAETLLQAEQLAYFAHIARTGIHPFNDIINVYTYTPVAPGNLSLDLVIANHLKIAYNGHLQPTYPVSIQNVFVNINQVSSFDAILTESCPGVSNAYSFYVELCIGTQASTVPSINVFGTITSEDGGSTTNPGDFTGSFAARPAASPAVSRFTYAAVESPARFEFDREIDLSGSPLLEVLNPSGLQLPNFQIERTATISSVRWALKQLMTAYVWHISVSGAVHQNLDIVNLISGSDYPGPKLSTILTSINKIRSVLISHMGNSTVHYHRDPLVDQLTKVPPATDLDSVAALLGALRDIYVAHNLSVGPHLARGPRIVSAPIFNALEVTASNVVDGQTLTFNAQVHDIYRENLAGDLLPHPTGVDKTHSLTLSIPFVGIATAPYVASAVAKNGVRITNSGPVFESDSVQVFFSKPMFQVPLTPSNLSITGGVLLQQGAGWISDSVASVGVTNMRSLSYTVSASGLTDLAGNTIL